MNTEPAIVVAALWLLFAGTHIALALRRPRALLVGRLGEGGFIALFSVVAAVSFAALVGYYATHRFAGAPGLGLGSVAAVRWLCMATIASGVALITAGLIAYPRMPMALFDQSIKHPRGIERITRHPFFVGMALFAVPHVLLATRLVGAVFALGFAALAIAGARHQDAKLLARRGPAYAGYLAATSTLPMAAILAGRQHLAWRELPLAGLAVGLGLAVALRLNHAALFAHGGLYVVLAVVGGAALASWQTWRRAQRHTPRRASSSLQPPTLGSKHH